MGAKIIVVDELLGTVVPPVQRPRREAVVDGVVVVQSNADDRLDELLPDAGIAANPDARRRVAS